MKAVLTHADYDEGLEMSVTDVPPPPSMTRGFVRADPRRGALRRAAGLRRRSLRTVRRKRRAPIFGLVSIIGRPDPRGTRRASTLAGTAAVELLRELMAEHGIRQSDLPEVGTQSVVSEVLAGKRGLNLRQVKALSNASGS